MTNPDRQVVEMMTDARLPHETLGELRTFADAVVVVRVIAERAGAPEPPLVPRTVTVEIEQRLWERASVPRIPDRLTFDDFGWVQKDGEEVPTKSADGPRLEVGRRYYMPLARYADGSVEGLAAGAILEVSDGRIVADEQDTRPFVVAFRGKTTSEVAAAIRAAEPLAGSEEFMHLDPVARFEALPDPSG